MFQRLLLTIRHAWAMWQVLSLPKNRVKGPWHQQSAMALVCLAEMEMKELKEEVLAYNRGQGAASLIAAEAADVSAYVAMVADVCR
jgi:hypothetical protein